MKKVTIVLHERKVKGLKRVLNENAVIEVDNINQNNYKEYIGKTVKVTGDVDLFELYLTKLPINFTEVGGNFWCDNNELTSLEGCPKEVGKDFYCSHNELTSLAGAPEEVGGIFTCSYNQLTSLEGAPRKVGGNFYCYYNKLESTKDKPEFIGGRFLK